ncbi:hypothetical protein Fmac_025194 [Flemingia macrophylla]|uniref:Uncharacterized protein n=1 Tax=Flemingia macrophylla TaxID=520843 RepID=A0ABD1LRN9_9FABA
MKMLKKTNKELEERVTNLENEFWLFKHECQAANKAQRQQGHCHTSYKCQKTPIF